MSLNNPKIALFVSNSLIIAFDTAATPDLSALPQLYPWMRLSGVFQVFSILRPMSRSKLFHFPVLRSISPSINMNRFVIGENGSDPGPAVVGMIISPMNMREVGPMASTIRRRIIRDILYRSATRGKWPCSRISHRFKQDIYPHWGSHCTETRPFHGRGPIASRNRRCNNPLWCQKIILGQLSSVLRTQCQLSSSV